MYLLLKVIESHESLLCNSFSSNETQGLHYGYYYKMFTVKH